MSAEPLEMMFRSFRLPTMASRCAQMMESAEAQNWGYLIRACFHGLTIMTI